jgi:hypothetical protein
VVTRAVDIPVALFIAQGTGAAPGLAGGGGTTNQVQRRNVDTSALPFRSAGQQGMQ